MTITNEKNPIALREVLIALGIFAVMFIFGAIFDYDLSNAVFGSRVDNPSMYGIIGAGISELPVTFCLCLGGALLLKSGIQYKGKKVFNIFGIILGVVGLGVGAYFVFDTFCDIYKFPSTVSSKTLIIVLGILLTLIMVALAVYLVFVMFKDTDLRIMTELGFILIFTAGVVAASGNIFKWLWSRPRPRLIFTSAEYEFHPVWVLDPFKSFFTKDVEASFYYYGKEAFKSFPSGHSMYAACALYALPYMTLLSNEHKNNRKMQVFLFYLAVVLSIFFALSRVWAGAHFLSDVSMGLIVGLLFGLLVNRFGYFVSTKLIDYHQSKLEHIEKEI